MTDLADIANLLDELADELGVPRSSEEVLQVYCADLRIRARVAAELLRLKSHLLTPTPKQDNHP